MANLEDLLVERSGEAKAQTANMIGGGSWGWTLGTQILTWSADAYIQVIALEDTYNTIQAGNVTLAAGEIAYVQVVGDATGVNNLVVTVAAISAVPEIAGLYVVARRDGDDVIVANEFRLLDSQSLKLGQTQTDAEIKTAYENNADTNAYTDADTTKLGGIEAGATADQTDAEIKTAYENNANTNAYTDAEKLEVAANTAKISFTEGAAVTANTAKVSADGSITTHSDVGGATPVDAQALVWVAANNRYEPATPTALPTDAEIKTAYENNPDTNAFTDADTTKLDGIEAGATNTTNPTGSEIKVAYEAEANTNAYTDAEKLEVAANTAKISFTEGAAVTANTAKVSADGSITTHSDVGGAAPVDTQVLTWVAANNQYEPGVGGGGGGETFSDIPLVPSVTGNDITLGPSTIGGIDLIINGSPLERLNNSVITIKPTGITQYTNLEYYSAVVTYSSTSDSFEVQYSRGSHATRVAAIAAAPAPNPFNFNVCKISAQVTTSTPVANTLTLYATAVGDVLTFYDSPDLSTQTSTQTVEVQGEYYWGKDLAVSFVNNTFASVQWQYTIGKNQIKIFDLTTLALLHTVDSTTATTGTDFSSATSIVYNSATDKYVIFTAEGGHHGMTYLITHRDPLTGVETSATTGALSGSGYRQFANFMVYIPGHDVYLYAKNQHYSYSFRSVNVADYTETLVPGLVGDNQGSLVYDSILNELWWYDWNSPAKVFAVSAFPSAFTLTYLRDEAIFNPERYSGAVAGWLEGGEIVDTISGVEALDTRGVITENMSPGPLYAPGDVTISSARTYDTLVINGNLNITAATTVTGDVFVGGDLTVDATCVFNGKVNVRGALVVNNSLTIDDNLLVGGNLTANGSCKFNGNVTATGDVAFSQRTTISGNITAYNLDIQTTGNHEFAVLGSIIVGHPTDSISSVTAIRVFNVGGDIKQAYSDRQLDLTFNMTNLTNSGVDMSIGGSVYCTDFRWTTEDGRIDRLRIGGGIYCSRNGALIATTSSTVAVNGVIITCKEIHTEANIELRGGNVPSGTYEGAGIYVTGDVSCSNFYMQGGNASDVGALGGTTRASTIFGNLTSRSAIYLGMGASNTTGAPRSGGSRSLTVSGDLHAPTLWFNRFPTQLGTGPQAQMMWLNVSRGTVCVNNLNIGEFTGGTGAPIALTARWIVGSWRISTVNVYSDQTPPASVDLYGDLFYIGRYVQFGTRTMPGMVAGSTGTADKVPQNVCTSASGQATRRDTTGSGTNYIWRMT